MQYWIDGDKIRFDNGVDSGYFTSEATGHYQEYLAWVAEGNIAEEWNQDANQ